MTRFAHFGGPYEDRALPLRLERRLADVSEILAVDLQRQRSVAPDLDPVDVVAVQDILRARLGAA